MRIAPSSIQQAQNAWDWRIDRPFPSCSRKAIVLTPIGVNPRNRGHRRVTKTAMDTSKCLLTLFGDPNYDSTKSVIEILDRSGLAYSVKSPSAWEESTAGSGKNSQRNPFPILAVGEHVLSPTARSDVIDFLWAHGARFEDS
jgi:hypothetical protein